MLNSLDKISSLKANAQASLHLCYSHTGVSQNSIFKPFHKHVHNNCVQCLVLNMAEASRTALYHNPNGISH